MSKKFKGKTCVYCASAPSASADHVIAREFFLPDARANLPKAPACKRCNGEKARLEHYLTSLLPFAGRHPNAAVTLETLVPKRLDKNEALRRELTDGTMKGWSLEQDGLYVPVMTLPIDGTALEQLYALIVKGLIWHHWKTVLPKHYGVEAKMYTAVGLQLFKETFFALNPGAIVKGNLGNGAFLYEGRQGVNAPQVSVWLMSLYGVVATGDDAEYPMQWIGAITGPESFWQKTRVSAGRSNRQQM